MSGRHKLAPHLFRGTAPYGVVCLDCGRFWNHWRHTAPSTRGKHRRG